VFVLFFNYHAGLEVEEHRAWYVRAALGIVVKHVNAAELRVFLAAVLAVAPMPCLSNSTS
jgi:hypothetical protein